MYINYMLLIMLIACLNVGYSTATYNYYELAVQKWCSTDYMIHGFWPQFNSTAYPENCKKVSYVEPVGTLLTNMNTYWHKCDNTLWEHEWEKHGSCVQEQNNMDEDTYFNTALSLFLENKNLLENCKEEDCILGCFDLDYNLIKCE
jgi:ribonuclease I